MAIEKCPFTKQELLDIGYDIASGWGGECYDAKVDNKKKEVVFYCIENGERFITTESFECLNVRKLANGKSAITMMFDKVSKEDLKLASLDPKALDAKVEAFAKKYNEEHSGKVR